MSLFGLIFGALAAGNAVKEKITYFDDEAYKADSNNPNITITELVRRRNSGYYTKVLTPSNREQKEIYELKGKLARICEYNIDFKNRKKDIEYIEYYKTEAGYCAQIPAFIRQFNEAQRSLEYYEKRLKEVSDDFIRTESRLRQLDPTYKRTEEVEVFAKNVEEFLKEHRGK